MYFNASGQVNSNMIDSIVLSKLTLNLHKNTIGIDGSGYWKCTSLIDNLNYVLESEKKKSKLFLPTYLHTLMFITENKKTYLNTAIPLQSRR